MSNITRWEPFRDMVSMRKDMDRLIEQFFSLPTTEQAGWGLPMVDMYQTEEDIVVKATMPGLDPKDLDIQVTGDILTIRGEIKKEEVKEGVGRDGQTGESELIASLNFYSQQLKGKDK